jgi:hypothetical protein
MARRLFIPGDTALKTRQSPATIYKTDRKSAAEGAHYADSCAADRGEIYPVYRGFKLSCLSAELPAKQRAIDALWSRACFAAQDRAGREACIRQEREWRDAPREWL